MQGPQAAEQDYFRLNWLAFLDKDLALIPAASVWLHLTTAYLFSCIHSTSVCKLAACNESSFIWSYLASLSELDFDKLEEADMILRMQAGGRNVF